MDNLTKGGSAMLDFEAKFPRPVSMQRIYRTIQAVDAEATVLDQLESPEAIEVVFFTTAAPSAMWVALEAAGATDLHYREIR
jgi:hypothetical protein